jgi:hypothetical protein
VTQAEGKDAGLRFACDPSHIRRQLCGDPIKIFKISSLLPMRALPPGSFRGFSPVPATNGAARAVVVLSGGAYPFARRTAISSRKA